MGTNEYSQPASKLSWDGQDFGDVKMVVKMAHFHKSSRPQWVKSPTTLRFFQANDKEIIDTFVKSNPPVAMDSPHKGPVKQYTFPCHDFTHSASSENLNTCYVATNKDI